METSEPYPSPRACAGHPASAPDVEASIVCGVVTVLIHPAVPLRHPDGEAAVTAGIVRLAARFGRSGYRRITALLRSEGWRVNAKRVEQVWPREGLKLPRRHPKWECLRTTDGSCVRLRPAHKDHVWGYDLIAVRTQDGRPLRLFTVLDAYTRECLTIEVSHHIRADDALHFLTRLTVTCGVPAQLRSDNGPEFAARLCAWLPSVGERTLFIDPAILRKTATSKLSTANCATSSSIRKYSTCGRTGAQGGLAGNLQLDPSSQLPLLPATGA